jgi:hypothetical protein
MNGPHMLPEGASAMLTFFVVAIVALFVLAGAGGSGRGWFIDWRWIGSAIRELRRRTDPLFRRTGLSLDE